jgi:hypothetical protein
MFFGSSCIYASTYTAELSYVILTSVSAAFFPKTGVEVTNPETGEILCHAASSGFPSSFTDSLILFAAIDLDCEKEGDDTINKRDRPSKGFLI